MTSSCHLSIIIVSWNVRDLLHACLASIARTSAPDDEDLRLRTFGPAQEEATLEVIVVDNASRDDTVAMLQAEFPWVRVAANDDNRGFTGGNNQGYAASRGRFVYFLNPDTELANAESLWTLYAAVAHDPSVGLAGPQLRYGDGAHQPSARSFPTRLTGFFESTWLGRSLPHNPWTRRFHQADRGPDQAGEVDWLVGAAMLARRTALEEIRLPGMAGPFDEGFFMYSEELDLCRRLKNAGWRVLYVPDSRVIHYEGRSSEQVVTARHINFNASRVRLYAKYFGPGWAEALRRYLLLEYRFQLHLEQAKRGLGSRPDLRTERIAAYREVLAHGLREDVTNHTEGGA
ncbi:MAG: glycosyltransferase family 2 protein [Caldilineaceae bacterium]|nr:glycosyltransferase family 2 protein [Caldilineaceae bacterium]